MRRSSARTVQRVGRVNDLTVFNNRRVIKIAGEVDKTTDGPSVHTFTNRGFGAFASLGALISSFNASRLLKLEIWFDQRGSGSTAAVPRCAAFLLPGSSSDYTDVSKSGTLASYAGRGLQQINPSRPLTLKVGPEFVAGRFNDIENGGPGDVPSTLFLATEGYSGKVRIISYVEVLGVPELLFTPV